MDPAQLSLLVSRSIRVDRGGPESRTGKLLAVKKDHFVMYVEDEGMVYYNTDHIKSLSVDTHDVSDLIPDSAQNETETPKFSDTDDFQSVMKNMKFRWVQINRGGPEKVEGVLVEVASDRITLISGNEVIQLLPFHIRNISYGVKKSNDKDNKDGKNGGDNKGGDKDGDGKGDKDKKDESKDKNDGKGDRHKDEGKDSKKHDGKDDHKDK